LATHLASDHAQSGAHARPGTGRGRLHLALRRRPQPCQDGAPVRDASGRRP
jgi:hypothetical protein